MICFIEINFVAEECLYIDENFWVESKWIRISWILTLMTWVMKLTKNESDNASDDAVNDLAVMIRDEFQRDE